VIDADEQVILVDLDDRELGTAPKIAAHREGRLHRALSVVLVDPDGRMLLQKRQQGKYHSGGLWTNTCCSHPRPGEPVSDAAHRRLGEEMGIRTSLTPFFAVHYRAELDKGMTEHEVVHVFGGRYAGSVRPDPLEADGFDWIDATSLRHQLEAAPERYSIWFRKYCIEYWSELNEGLLRLS
jgi:isopentenyl-diphosphate delta-isomerase